jgi:glycosyltransferase involved in cell wall biosynthesis
VNVVHLISADLWAGREVATFELLRALVRRDDVQPAALLLNEGILARRLREAGVPTFVEPESGRTFPALARAVRKRVAGAALVHSHGYKEDVLAAFSGRPWITTQHGRPEPFRGAARLRFLMYDWLDRTIQRASARRVVAVSREIEDWLAPRVGAGRVARIGNGIADPAHDTPIPVWRERPLRAGVAARLFPVKGVDLAVAAVACCPGIELEVVGDGPERGALERLARELGASDRIRFLGFEADPVPRMAKWRLLLVPSLHEGNPIAVLEALAMGTPVLAGPLPGVAEILAGHGGWTLADRDVGTWSAALDRHLRAEDRGDATSRAGRSRFVEAFRAELPAATMATLYHAVLGAASA